MARVCARCHQPVQRGPRGYDHDCPEDYPDPEPADSSDEEDAA